MTRLEAPLRGLSGMFGDARIRVPATMVAMYLIFLIYIPFIDRYNLVIADSSIRDMLVNVFMVVLTLVLYVLTLYTVLAQEENDLVSRREQILRLMEYCNMEEIQQEAEKVLRVIDKTLRDISRTWVRWLVYELPYAYTIVFSTISTSYLYRAQLQVDGLFALLLPAHVTWGKVLGMFCFILVASGAALAYVFRRGYERKFLVLYARSTECIRLRRRR